MTLYRIVDSRGQRPSIGDTNPTEFYTRGLAEEWLKYYSRFRGTIGALSIQEVDSQKEAQRRDAITREVTERGFNYNDGRGAE